VLAIQLWVSDSVFTNPMIKLNSHFVFPRPKKPG